MFEKPLGLRENPFLAGHHPRYLFPSREHQEALAHLRYGIQNREPFVLITGEVGTGKTTAVYDALAEWGSRAVVALITNSALSRAELLEEICLRFGVNLPSPVSKPQALVELQKRLSEVRGRGELAILLVDEAQNLDRELLEEIRLLSNLEVSGTYLLQIFLVGQPELETNLAQKELRQLRQRIGIHYRILPLSGTEASRYIHHRVSVAGGNAEELFPHDTCAEIFRITNGIPREINIVAGQSLLNAFVDDSRAVTVEHVRAVEREIEFQSVIKKHPDASAAAKPARPAALPAAPVPETTALPAPTFKVEGVVAEDEVEEEFSAHAFDETGVDEESANEPDGPPEPEPGPEVEPEPDTERPETGIRRVEAEAELVLPSWIDEIVQRRQAMEQRMAALSSPQPAAPTQTPPPPPIPLPTPELLPMRGQSERGPAELAPEEFGSASGAMLAAPPPERPQPAEPIPLFDHRARAEHLPPRLRHKLTEEDNGETAPRRSMLWPVAGILIAALAITGLLLVRFGPWTLERRGVEPANAPANAPAPTPAPVDTSVRTGTQYPPFDRMNQPGSEFNTRTAQTGTRNVPVTQAEPAPPPVVGTPPPAPSRAPVTTPSTANYGIAVGTFINQRRANAEQARIAESTQLASRVVTVQEDTISMYRVVVGNYPNRSAAERAAGDLVQRGLVSEARVVAVKP